MKNKLRLHKAVSQLIKNSNTIDYTNPEIQRNIEDFGVYVDDNLVKKRLEWTSSEQKIDITHWPKRELGNLKAIKVIKESDEFLLVFKPFNLVVQPGAGHTKDNLVTWLLDNHPEQKEIVNNAPEKSNAKITAGLVHRLDKDTQGLILIAKSLQDLDYFQNQFRNRKTEKKYLAIVNGIVDKNYHIKNWQARDKQNLTRQKLFWTEKEAMQYDQKARLAESIIKPKIVCKNTKQTLIEIQIKTGRMHQIRLQCEALGFPLTNDKVYNQHNTTCHSEQSEESFVHLKAFFPINKPKKLNQEEFNNLRKKIFHNTTYNLLSNYLKIQTKSGNWLEAEYYNL